MTPESLESHPFTMFDLSLGDCLEVMEKVESESIDLILADLPYGTTACRWDVIIPFEPLWAAYKRVLKPTGAVVLTACQPFTSKLVLSNPRWFRYEWVWDKVASTGFLDANRRPLRRHESILVFSPKRPSYHPQMTEGMPYTCKKKGHVTETLGDKAATKREWTTVNKGTRYPTSILRISGANGATKGKFHPTQKPVDLMEYLVLTYTRPGETVLDNTMGSGTTGIACMRLDRRFIGIERDPSYFAIAERRIQEARAQFLARVA